MRKFIFLIGSTDDFGDLEDLKNAYFDNTLADYNASYYEFEVPVNHDLGIALLVGRGLAFSNDWGMDGTLSTLLEA